MSDQFTRGYKPYCQWVIGWSEEAPAGKVGESEISAKVHEKLEGDSRGSLRMILRDVGFCPTEVPF